MIPLVNFIDIYYHLTDHPRLEIAIEWNDFREENIIF